MTTVLEFLQSLTETKRNNTVLGYLTAIAARHCTVKVPNKKRRRKISKHPDVQTWKRGLSLSNPEPIPRIPQWDLEVVLSALKQPPYFPLKKTSLKHLTLRTVFLVALTSARRASEIHALQVDTVQFGRTAVTVSPDDAFLPKVSTPWHRNQPIELPVLQVDADRDLRKLCVAASLKEYINRTRVARAGTGATQLFLCYGTKWAGQAVSKQRIAKWLQILIEDCHAIKGQPLQAKPKGHQVRKQSTSWADMAGVDPQKICDAAIWKSNSVFARHYKLDLLHQSRAELGRRVLQLSASRSAEVALRRHLGTPAAPASARARRN